MPPVPTEGVPLRVAVPLRLSRKLTPYGSAPVSLSAGAEEPAVVTVNDPAEPTVKLVLLALVKTPLAVIVTLTFVVLTNDPETPVIVSVNVESGAAGPTLRVNTEDAEPPAGGITEAGESEADTPAGGVDTLRVTAELNPPNELIVTDGASARPKAMVTGAIGLK